MMVVRNFFRRVCTGDHREGLYASLSRFGMHGDCLLGSERRDACDLEYFVTCQTQRFAVLSWLEFQRQHTHPDEVAAVDAFVALGDNRAHAEQTLAFRRPIAG